MKKSKLLLISLIIVFICITTMTIVINKLNSKTELLSIKSESQLENFYKGNKNYTFSDIFKDISTLPMSVLFSHPVSIKQNDLVYSTNSSSSIKGGLNIDSAISESTVNSSSQSSKDYSTTNIQVENVDEADITKTDGDYIYSLSDNNVIITDVKDPNNISVASKISATSGTPEDLILYNNKLVIISESSLSGYQNTVVNIYDISDRTSPKILKTYTMFEPYYTSRCINNKLYVISSGRLRKENNKIVKYYYEDNNQVDLNLKDIKYLKDIDTKTQTLISSVDLDNPSANINLQSYLIDISNAYVSQNNIYLLNSKYTYRNSKIPISSLFTWRGILGPIYYEDNNINYSTQKTSVYKFNILDDGSIKYDAKTKVNGSTINQFSVDEYNGNLRLALHDNNGSKVVVLNEKLEQIGETSYLAKGENMYSSRFMGNKAYLVTYKTMDPLYAIDLSNPNTPKVLGELKIPGYSTYLHPYDENHIIGIGMETKENIRRNSSGRVISTTSTIVGMKMALFDVSNVNNPIQISNTVIGDSRTSSAILSDHKALLFSKEKELIAIPVNNYAEDFEINDTSNNYSSIVNSYTNYKKNYLSEGYLVYNINLQEGFKLKGKIVHDEKNNNTGYYHYGSKMLRGLYIEDNLYTVSEDMIKVNSLDDLKLLSKLQLRESNNYTNNQMKKTIIAY